VFDYASKLPPSGIKPELSREQRAAEDLLQLPNTAGERWSLLHRLVSAACLRSGR
jgi:hypothetical protein